MELVRVVSEDFLSERQRAEDILLGSLGYGEDARIVTISSTLEGFAGEGRFSDGELFDFKSDDELSELERWALLVLQK